MRKKLLGLLILSISLNVYARFPNLDNILYRPLASAKDLKVEIHTDELSSLVEEKLLLKELPRKWDVYRLNQETLIDLGAVKLEPPALNYRLRNNLVNKSQHAWHHSINDFLDNLKFKKRTDDWYHYEDETELLNLKSLKVKFKRNILSVEIVRDKTREVFNYFYEKTSWSNNKLVLKSIVVDVFEGKEKTTEVLNYDYAKLTTKHWLVSKLSIVTTQNSAFRSKSNKVRSLTETYSFKNYKIDKNFASRWFKSHKY